MSKNSVLLLPAVLALVLAAPSAAAEELWVAPGRELASTGVGNWSTTANGAAHFSFAVPDDMDGFTAARVVVIGAKDAQVTYDLSLSVSGDGQPEDIATADATGLFATLAKNTVSEIDVSSVFPTLAAGDDLIGLTFDLHPPGFARVVGLRFLYATADRLAGVACPSGELLTGFDAQGQPSCVTVASLLAGITCPDGQSLVGFDAVGDPVCIAIEDSGGGGGGSGGGGGGEVVVAIANASVAEGASGTTSLLNFTVALSASSTGTISVDFATADGTATTSSGDYVAASGTLTFFPGQVSQTVAVTVNGDDTSEDHETMFVNLSNPSGASLGVSQGLGTIVNDDNGGGDGR